MAIERTTIEEARIVKTELYTYFRSILPWIEPEDIILSFGDDTDTSKFLLRVKKV